MARSVLRLVALCGALALLSSCSHKAVVPGDPKTIVYENVKAMENEDLERVMATIDDQSEAFDQTKKLAERLFETYDLRYELDSVRVLGQTETEAKVECLQTTRRVNGPAFRDNRIDIVHRLRNTDGYWRIYGSEIKRIEYLN